MQALDERDAAMVAGRMAALDEIEGPRVGDFVRFADGTLRRVSHIWRDEGGAILPNGVQTSDGGRYYLGDGYVSMSGGLHPGIDAATLTDTGERREGAVWVFRHDWWKAHNGVDTFAAFRLFSCSLRAR